jgi:hypothetical protein
MSVDSDVDIFLNLHVQLSLLLILIHIDSNVNRRFSPPYVALLLKHPQLYANRDQHLFSSRYVLRLIRVQFPTCFSSCLESLQEMNQEGTICAPPRRRNPGLRVPRLQSRSQER